MTGNHRKKGPESQREKAPQCRFLANGPSLSARLFGTRVSCPTTRHREHALGTSWDHWRPLGHRKVWWAYWPGLYLQEWLVRSHKGWTVQTQTELQQRPFAGRACIRGRLTNVPLTSFLSFRLVTMTMVAVFCSQIILQKSFTVSSFGPKAVNSKNENPWQGKKDAETLETFILDFGSLCPHIAS